MSNYRRYNYPNRSPRGDRPVNMSLVPYISCVGVPWYLVGVSVKNIVSDREYAKMVKECKTKEGNNCQLCGRWVARSREDFLYVQEIYDKDLDGGVFSYRGMVGVCRECFYIFNPYILELNLKSFTVNDKFASRVRRKRATMLETAGLSPVKLNRNKIFVLEYRGYKYINDFNTSILDRALRAGVRVLPMKKDFMAMHPDLYYHKPFS